MFHTSLKTDSAETPAELQPKGGFSPGIRLVLYAWILACTLPLKVAAGIQQQSVQRNNQSAPVTATITDVTAQDGEDEEEDESPEDLFDLDLDELGKVDASPDPVFDAESLNNEVMSVDGTKSTVGQSPAAVYVLTGEMIQRSGVRTIPDALRLIPGVQVSRLNSQLTSVTIRGFAGTFNNKVLVQVDGRLVYSQSYGGVFWDAQDMVLADIDRIEVIRGPGATVWGENAVNGVINIITKSAEDTVGNYFEVGGGDIENEFYSFSVGRSLGDVHYRFYGKYAERNPGLNINPLDNFGFYNEDGGMFGRYGFRSDYVPSEYDRVTTIVDFHHGGDFQLLRQEELYFAGTFPEQRFKTSGAFAMVRWNHKFCDHHDISFRAYYDRSNRDWTATIEKQDTFEIGLRHRRELSPRRERVTGLTGRYSKGRFFGTDFDLDFATFDLSIADPYTQLDMLSVYYGGGFIQEKWTLWDEKWYTWLGTKVGWNSFNGVNVQPSARSLFVVDEKSVVWGAISRAVRLPTRFDAGIQLEDPTVNFFSVPRTPEDQLISEEVLAYELGYRRQQSDRFSWELTGYYNDYKNLVEEGPLVSYYGTGPSGVLYRSTGQGYGAEFNCDVKVSDWWDIRGGCSYLNLEIEDDPDFFQYTGLRDEYSPDYMVYIQSLAQITPQLQWDMTCRYVDALHEQFIFDRSAAVVADVRSYIQLDTRINYRVNDRLDFTIAGRNLLDSDHLEFGGDDIFVTQARSNAERSIFAAFTWKTGRVPRTRETSQQQQPQPQPQPARASTRFENAIMR